MSLEDRLQNDLKAWVERDYVIPGVDFDLVEVGRTETELSCYAFFKIQYANGEISEGTIFEMKYDRTASKVHYSAFNTDGMLP